MSFDFGREHWRFDDVIYDTWHGRFVVDGASCGEWSPSVSWLASHFLFFLVTNTPCVELDGAAGNVESWILPVHCEAAFHANVAVLDFAVFGQDTKSPTSHGSRVRGSAGRVNTWIFFPRRCQTMKPVSLCRHLPASGLNCSLCEGGRAEGVSS